MTLLRETPKDHGLLLDHDPGGGRRLSVTLAGKSPRRNGRRLQYATGPLYQRCFQHVSAILWRYHGQRLQPPEAAARQYYPITEETAVQIRLLLDAVGRTPPGGRGSGWPGRSPVCIPAKAVGGTPATKTAAARAGYWRR